MGEKIKILAFAGSLRKGSFNKALIRAAIELAPENMEMLFFDLEGIPPFNQDDEDNPPERVREFKEKIKAADALLIATPEYNYSIPGVLKNAIDWASRPKQGNPFEDKPVAIMSASSGRLGGARAQYHLRQCFVFLNMHSVNRPEIMLPFAKDYIDNSGKLTNEETKKLIRELLEELLKWTGRLRVK